MEALPVAIPWNLSCYIRANGFHPLYRALFEDNPRIIFQSVDEVALAKRLRESDRVYSELLKRRTEVLREVPTFFGSSAAGKRFIDYLSGTDVALAAEIPGAIELHHTSPLTVGIRPFVFHCESFLPIFEPFWSQGIGRLHDVEEVRSLYHGIFSSSACLGIFSHIPTTLEQISRFFGDPAIDAKLQRSRIGLSQAQLAVLLDPRPRATGQRPVFLFTSSAHQSSRSFELRGGLTALLFAQKYLQAGRKGEFLFRAKRPPSSALRVAGIDVPFLSSVEGTKLFWLEGFLPEHEQLRLFAVADFLLLPSVNLHSMTLMQALAGGAVPVVSDTHGPEYYVTDDVTGIVLRGVRDAVWHEDAETGIAVDQHQLPPKLPGNLADQALTRITRLLDSNHELEAMRVRMREAVRQFFLGAQFRDEMTEALLRLSRHADASSALGKMSRTILTREHLVRKDGWERMFESPPQPMLVANTGGARLLFCKGSYFLVRGDLQLALDELSPLVLREQHYLDPWKVQIGAEIRDFGDAVFWSYGKAGLRAAKLRYARFRLQEKVKELLWPHRRLYRFARWSYRSVAGIRRKLARLGI